MFWRQQVNYGRAEALLERKWPGRFNDAGHPSWAGQIYDAGRAWLGPWRARVYHGVWGGAPFQRLYESRLAAWPSLLALPEWHLVVLAFAAAALLGRAWAPLSIATPLLALSLALVLASALLGARDALHRRPLPLVVQGLPRLRIVVMVAVLHWLQPIARLRGRLRGGLSPWRHRVAAKLAWPRLRQWAVWTASSKTPEDHLTALHRSLSAGGSVPMQGDAYDRWDLGVRVGPTGVARLLMAIEDHGSGYQYVRVRWWPRPRPLAIAGALALAVLAVVASLDHAWLVAAVLGVAAASVAALTLHNTAAAQAALQEAAEGLQRRLTEGEDA
jgi:hypothetical protein